MVRILVLTITITCYYETPWIPKYSERPYVYAIPLNPKLSRDASSNTIAGTQKGYYMAPSHLFSALQEIAAYRYPYQSRADSLIVHATAEPALNALDPRVHTHFGLCHYCKTT